MTTSINTTKQAEIPKPHANLHLVKVPGDRVYCLDFDKLRLHTESAIQPRNLSSLLTSNWFATATPLRIAMATDIHIFNMPDITILAGDETMGHKFPLLPHHCRKRLADYKAPTIDLVLTYDGLPEYHASQIAAAKSVAGGARCKQLDDQANSNFPRSIITFPLHAICAASATIRLALQDSPDSKSFDINIGPLLPGYFMEALDWYLKALRKETWEDYAMPDGDTDEHEALYYFYVYAAMRRLGMGVLAHPLLEFLRRKFNTDGLSYQSVEDVVRYLETDDPIFRDCVDVIAKKIKVDNPPRATYKADMAGLTQEGQGCRLFWQHVDVAFKKMTRSTGRVG